MEGGGACGDTDCGGNVVGGWTIDGNCLDSHPLKREDSLCPQGAFNILSVDASGKVVFRTDDTYSAKITTTNRVSIRFPPACRETGTGQQWTCAELNEAFALSPLDGTQSSSCAGGSDDCACTFVTTPTIISEDGTYTTTGGKMRMSHDDVTDVQESLRRWR